MKGNHKLVLAAVAGICIGIAGATAIHARQEKPAPGYVIAEVEITDPVAYKEYGDKVAQTMAPFNHHFVVRGGKTQSLEGEPPKSVIVIAFDSVEKAREWYESPAYQAIKPIRQNASKSRLFTAEGLTPQ